MTPSTIHWHAADQGLQFSTRDDLPRLRFPLDDSLEALADPGLALLEELWGEERAMEAEGEGRLLLPYTEVYGLSPQERTTLELPEPSSNIQGQIHTSSWINDDGFNIRLNCEHQTVDGHLPLLDEERTGAVFQTEDLILLVSEPFWKVLELLDQGVPEEISDRFVFVTRVQNRAKAAGIALDAYLSTEEFIFPESVGVEVDAVAPDEIHLRATAEGVDEDQFPKFLNDQEGERDCRTTYTSKKGDHRRRLVFSPEDRAAIDKVKKRRVLKGKDVPRFLANPEAFLPDTIDLSRFSPRVKGLVPIRYQSQPYLAIDQTGKRDWFAVSPQIELIPEPLHGDVGEHQEEMRADGSRHESLPGSEPDADADSGQSAPSIEPEDYKSLCEEVVETGDPHVLHGGSWITIEPEKAKRFLESWDQLERNEQGELGIPRSRVSLILDVIPNTEVLEYVEERKDFHQHPEVPEYEVPDSLNGVLRPHQVTGYRWIRFLEENRFGGLLADDMGLGKTVQVIAFLAHLLEEDRIGPTLLVVPKSLIQNWVREIRRFAPGIRLIYEHQGPSREKNPRRIGLFEVVITTYATLRRDQLILGQVDWRAVVCDEAQNVKNPTANVTAAVKGMKGHLRIAATGTPVENGLTELWCIMDFAQPGHLGSRREFRNLFERPIVEAPEGSPERSSAAETLHDRLVPHYVRRTKKEVLSELPPKRSEVYHVPLSEEQNQLYGSIIRAIRDSDTIPIAGLQRLIQVCSHPFLLRSGPPSSEATLDTCPKLRKTLEVLEEVREAGEKAVVFTRYKGMQRILQEVVRTRFGIVPRVLNGEVAGQNRLRMVDRFNDGSGFNLLILSPEAAGVGLNITGANHVIHYSRLWNPAKENQATDRVHRYGQTRPVTVHYPIVQGDGFRSVEEHLDQLLSEKQSLAEDVLVARDGLDLTAELADRVFGEDGEGRSS